MHSRNSPIDQLHLRREFLRGAGRVAFSAASLALLGGCGSLTAPNSASDRLETTTVRITTAPSICQAPSYLAEDILKTNGISDVQYVNTTSGWPMRLIASGEADFGLQFSGPLINQIDTDQPVVILAGVHVGCFVLFGGSQVHTILDLKGKSIAITAFDGADYVFLATLAAYVGLDPKKDINWVIRAQGDAKQLFLDGKVDAFLAFPPVVQELEAKKAAPVIVNSMVDTPWSQYYCCMIAGNPDFVRNNPAATKRVVSAILKATDTCALHPEQAARFIVDRGYTPNYDYALAMMKEIPYDKWRQYDPTDTLRFYSLRLREAGMVARVPDEIIARSADWRFLDQIKKESPRAYLDSGNFACTMPNLG